MTEQTTMVERVANDQRSAKDRARGAVRSALIRGRLVRPDRCQKCGQKPPTAKDGRSLIHAHHHKGYECPLDVEWLCVTCHFEEDPRVNGEASGRAKLTAAVVAAIRRLHRSGGQSGRGEQDGSARQLARHYGVSDRTIRRILAGEI